MADNAIAIQGHSVGSKDVGGVQYQQFRDAPATTALVSVVAVTTSSASAAIAADTTSRRQITIQNTGDVDVEISPSSGFSWGAGFLLPAGGVWGGNFNGAIYARTETTTGQIRAWSEN
jgi:hypothetical protein